MAWKYTREKKYSSSFYDSVIQNIEIARNILKGTANPLKHCIESWYEI
jgi:hypothetical protein